MAKRYITQGTQKQNTLAEIFTVILERKQTTRREIEAETGFSWGTVSSAVASLIERELVTEEKSDRGGVGRTTYLLRPNGARYVAIGLDMNRSGLTCEIVGLDLSLCHRMEEDFRPGGQGEVIEQAKTLCRRAIAWCEEHGLHVFSLGLAMQGAVDGRAGLSLRFPAVPDWCVFPIKEHFAEAFGLPVYLGHDPKCMLLGEMRRESLCDCVLVRIDDGIGMAVSLDGRILDDTERLELGHTVAVPGGTACGCGRRGCLEAYASVRAIAADAGVTGEELLSDPARFDDDQARAGELMATALYNTYVLFRPQKIILTGKALRLTRYIERARSALDGEEVEILLNPHVSAAYGAAVESMRSAVRALTL